MTIMRKVPTFLSPAHARRARQAVLGVWMGFALLMAGPAPARATDTVYWSIGVAPSPGVSFVAGNAPPVRLVTPVILTPPTYVVISSHAYPPVLYGPPRVVYAPPPVYVQAAPVVVLPPAHWGYQPHQPHRHPGRGWGHGRHDGQGHGHGAGHYRH